MTTDTEHDGERLGAGIFGFGMVWAVLLGIFIGPRSHGSRAVDTSADSELAELRGALMEYALENGGNFPLTLDSLLDPRNNSRRRLANPGTLLDPWNRGYRYSVLQDRTGFSLFTLGADGEKGGDGENEDLYVLVPSALLGSKP